ncbi:amidohydrolase family protein [Fulvivirgaceae bacterium BMA10]|uniref:Amidohydrolase family protein n=1 Tax=Splendidivirga corallicola TaxID=3051826 RepID=A0ABT8KLM2_9BACT|nr:amidohydrolase family protein [Fulvivirgaceae bacterium BMA10]
MQRQSLIRYLLIATLMTFALIGYSQKTYIHCGNLIDGKSDRPQSKITIIVNGNEIESVERGFKKPGADDKLIDLSGKTVLPGLMDMHVHLEMETSPTRYSDQFRLNKTDVAFRSIRYAERTLMAGFTTVRDLGGTGVNISMRKAIEGGYIPGPRIYTAGKSIATTGGHADPTNGVKYELMDDPGPREGVINGSADARKAVRQRYKNGADVIKITATGGVLSVAKDGQGPQFTDEELQAIVATAKDYGMVTAAHAHGKEGMKRAILAGINSIEHGTLMDEEIMDLMKKHGTYYVPTISAGRFVAEKAKVEGYYPKLVVPKALELGPKIQQTFTSAYQKGVRIAFGTDAGVFPHGQNGKEFGYMVEAGMPAMLTIKSATMVAAELLRIDDKLGSIESGKLADIIAVDEDPIKNIATLEKVTFVMKDGVVYKQPNP